MNRLTALSLLVLLLTCFSPGRSKSEPKRLSQSQLEQLADVLFRIRQDAKSISFRYVIAYSELSESQVIELAIEPVAKKDYRTLDVFTFAGTKCMAFYEENVGIIRYDKNGKAFPDEIYYGGMLASDTYWQGIRNIRSTPLLTFHRKDVRHTCARLNLLMDPGIEDFQRREAQTEKAKRRARKP